MNSIYSLFLTTSLKHPASKYKLPEAVPPLARRKIVLVYHSNAYPVALTEGEAFGCLSPEAESFGD